MSRRKKHALSLPPEAFLAGSAFQGCCRLHSLGVSLPSPLAFSFRAASEHLREPGCSQGCEAGRAVPRPVAS